MQLPHQNETIAEWIAGATGLAPYGDRWMQRYGALVARSKPYKRAKPKGGSFKEVAGKTRVINADKVAKELKELVDTRDLKSLGSNAVRVQVSLRAPKILE